MQTVRGVYEMAPGNIDFVLYWWLKAADALLKGGPRRFGFVTTKSISQSFARRLTRPFMGGKKPLRVAFAIPNHPWIDASDGADVRIAMTAWDLSADAGHLAEVINEEPGELGEYKVALASTIGKINPRLQVGGDVDDAKRLTANRGMCSVGYQIGGAGFFLSEEDVRLAALSGPIDIVRPNVAAAALVANRPARFVIDASDLSEATFASQYPYLYQRVAASMKSASIGKAKDSSHKTWWRFQRPREDLRTAIRDLSRIIVRPLTSKHAIFRFGDLVIAYDSTCVIFALDDAFHFGILQSVVHTCWFEENLGRLGVGDDPRYLKSDCFDPFPFPDTSDEVLKARIRDAAEKLDALRKEVLARHADLTLTGLYNSLEALRAAEGAGTVLGGKDRDVAERGCVSLIRQYHDEIDAAAAEAYGWPADLPDEDILERLVALNKERAAEEAKGKVRWLRPEFQAPDYAAPLEQAVLALPEAEKPAADILEWPGALPEQVVAVAGVVSRSGRPVAANDVARAFKGKRAATVTPVLDALAGMGRVRKLEDGRYAA